MNYTKDPNNLDWGSMSKRDFKQAELHYELAHENVGFIYKLEIDDKVWNKVFNSLAHVQSAMRTLEAKGKKVKILKYSA
jgi:hypothetical protein